MEEKNEIIKAEETTLMDITSLPPKQQRFLNLYLTGAYTHQELANLLRVHINTVGNWLRLPIIQEYIKLYQEEEHKETRVKLNAMTKQAVETMYDLLDSPIDGIRYQASRDILDRAGHKTSQKMEIKKEVFNYEQRISQLIESTITEEDVIELAEGDYSHLALEDGEDE